MIVRSSRRQYFANMRLNHFTIFLSFFHSSSSSCLIFFFSSSLKKKKICYLVDFRCAVEMGYQQNNHQNRRNCFLMSYCIYLLLLYLCLAFQSKHFYRQRYNSYFGCKKTTSKTRRQRRRNKTKERKNLGCKKIRI